MEKIIEMKNLKKYFPMKKKTVLKAVDNVTMDIYKTLQKDKWRDFV